MALTDDDLELLETYLDGELSAGEAAALRERVSASAELAGGLEMLRAERATRAQAWRTFEPSTLEVDRLNDRLERTIGDVPLHPVWDRVIRIGRVVTAAAACLVMGIAIGRIGNQPGPIIAPGGGPGGQVAGAGGGSSQQNVPVDVIVTDQMGRVFMHRFPSEAAARQFIEELRRAREQRLRESTPIHPQAPQPF